MNITEFSDILDDHTRWLWKPEIGKQADLRGIDLQWTIDYTCFPLWIGSKGMIIDRRIAAQIAAHFCAFECDDPDYIAARKAILEFAKSSDAAKRLGLLEESE
jgi:hypothetical protein